MNRAIQGKELVLSIGLKHFSSLNFPILFYINNGLYSYGLDKYFLFELFFDLRDGRGCQ